MIRRRLAILTLLGLFPLFTGALEYLHNLEHEQEDAVAAAVAQSAGQPASPAPVHDENNCPVHAQLHMPSLPAAWVPLLILLGLFVAFLTMLSPEPVARRPAFQIDCRGPPIC